MSAQPAGPKLLTRKPKGFRRSTGGASVGMDVPNASAGAPPPPPPKPPLLYRMRGVFGALLTLNLVVAGYMLFRGPGSRAGRDANAGDDTEKGEAAAQGPPNKRHEKLPVKELQVDESSEKESVKREKREEVAAMQKDGGGGADHAEAVKFAPLAAQARGNATGLQLAEVAQTTPPPVKKVMSESQVKEVLSWILNEKRKVKPQDRAEKARIDEDKKLIKDFLRAKSHPPLM